MSTFNCSTDQEDENFKSPLLFSQLEVLTNWLLNVSISLEEEFHTKSEFVNESFIKIIKNEVNLEQIANTMATLQNNILDVEGELQGIEFAINDLNNCAKRVIYLSSIENYCKCRNCRCNLEYHCCHILEREIFLKLLQDTGSALEKLPDVIAKINECQSYAVWKNPYEQIFAILNCHCEVLKNTEKNIDLLVDKLSVIEQQKMEINKKT